MQREIEIDQHIKNRGRFLYVTKHNIPQCFKCLQNVSVACNYRCEYKSLASEYMCVNAIGLFAF